MKKVKLLIIFPVLMLIMTSCVTKFNLKNPIPSIPQKPVATQNHSEYQGEFLSDESLAKLEEIFKDGKYFYDSQKMAELLSEKLQGVGCKEIKTVSVDDKNVQVIKITVVDEIDKKYCCSVDAETGFVSVIYENEFGGEALYYEID